MTEEKKAYYRSRQAFEPEAGGAYENEGGGTFRCLKSYRWLYDRSTAVMQNVKSGWTFTAHGIGIYKDGRIDWDYSTDGHFGEVTA